jgi:hypothetical protein
LEGHGGSSLVLAGDISTQPEKDIVIITEIVDWWDINHARTPGTAEYDPATHRNVPKYFTPVGASEMLMVKPTALERRLAKMNGQRSLSLSEKCEDNNRRMAVEQMALVWANWRFKTGMNSLATAYGGTVRRSETAAEYTNPLMIEGKKRDIP